MNKTEKAKNLLKNINTDDEVDEILELLDGSAYIGNFEGNEILRQVIEDGDISHWETRSDVQKGLITTTIEVHTPLHYYHGN